LVNFIKHVFKSALIVKFLLKVIYRFPSFLLFDKFLYITLKGK